MNPQALAERRAANAAIRARIRLTAQERGLSDAEIKGALSLRPKPFGEFATRHCLSFEWLLEGDLSGLLCQVRGRTVGPTEPMPPPLDAHELLRAISALSPEALNLLESAILREKVERFKRR